MRLPGQNWRSPACTWRQAANRPVAPPERSVATWHIIGFWLYDRRFQRQFHRHERSNDPGAHGREGRLRRQKDARRELGVESMRKSVLTFAVAAAVLAATASTAPAA